MLNGDPDLSGRLRGTSPMGLSARAIGQNTAPAQRPHVYREHRCKILNVINCTSLSCPQVPGSSPVGHTLSVQSYPAYPSSHKHLIEHGINNSTDGREYIRLAFQTPSRGKVQQLSSLSALVYVATLTWAMRQMDIPGHFDLRIACHSYHR